MNEVAIARDVYFESIAVHFVCNFHNEVLEHPTNICRAQVPFEETQNDEIIDP